MLQYQISVYSFILQLTGKMKQSGKRLRWGSILHKNENTYPNIDKIKYSSDSQEQTHQNKQKRKYKYSKNEWEQQKSRREKRTVSTDKKTFQIINNRDQGNDKIRSKSLNVKPNLYSYTRLGEGKICKISPQNLKNRLQIIINQTNCQEESQLKSTLITTTNNEEEGQIKQPQYSQHQQLPPHRLRYYDNITKLSSDERVIRCYNCGKKGHISKNCLQQKQKVKCYYCLQNHPYFECSLRCCFRCGESGHLSNNCKIKGNECFKCNRIGHDWWECGSVLIISETERHSRQQMYESKKDRNKIKQCQKYDWDNVKCLNGCRKYYGHYNCFKYQQDKSIYASKQRSSSESQEGKGKNDNSSSESEEQKPYIRQCDQKYWNSYDNY